MPAKLNQPIWPESRLNLTTPLNLLLTGMSMVVGVAFCLRGYTYEGSMMVYMLPVILLAWPYYSARYTIYMTGLVMLCFVPMSIWLQNKGVESGAWYYRPHDGYWLWITKSGEGWHQWTRHLWLGNDMPAMEYIFYPLFCMFQITLYSLYSHMLPDHWFERKVRRLKGVFAVIYLLLLAGFASLAFFYAKAGQTDYVYWLTSVGYILTGGAYMISRHYRDYSQFWAFWIWLIGMGVVFLPVWEIYHCCINHDWVYDPAHTFPILYSFNGAGFPVSQPFGYIATATTFHALVMLLIRRFGHIVIKDRKLVPFSRA